MKEYLLTIYQPEGDVQAGAWIYSGDHPPRRRVPTKRPIALCGNAKERDFLIERLRELSVD
jgi:hypothetical protein